MAGGGKTFPFPLISLPKSQWQNSKPESSFLVTYSDKTQKKRTNGKKAEYLSGYDPKMFLAAYAFPFL